MGQLEAYCINETTLTGLMITTFATEVTQTVESVTFESFKAQLYSSNSPSVKTLECGVQALEVITPDGAIFGSWALFNFNTRPVISMTKTLDDFQI